MKESEPKGMICASEPEIESVTQRQREEYRWNDPANPQGNLYQVEDREVNFNEFVGVIKKSVDTERGNMGHLLWVVMYINEFKDEIVELGMYLEFEELQKTAFDLVGTESKFGEDEKEFFLKTYERQVIEIYEKLNEAN